MKAIRAGICPLKMNQPSACPATISELHRTHQDYHRQDAQSAREFVTDDLRTASHGSDKRELIVGTPAGKQDTYHADARSGKQEEHAHVEVQHFQAFADRQAGEGEE